ncbi:DUF6447 family protein [Balneatrix alpica]|uniref:DUF6447 family protein n=1 Tax=Balneatrix alpica TaxID=75684 RepID=A0ABV5ZGA4_9GAMM|nr:DUF6447 family protein [Balneatrix alpica]
MSLPEYITINGTQYTTEKLSEAAKVQAANIQAVDEELARLQRQVSMIQTARNAYVAALIEAVKTKDEAAPAPKAKKPRAPRKTKAQAAKAE